MEYEAGDLRIEKETNGYYVQDKKRFSAYARMLSSDKDESFKFAYGMSYGQEGEHRAHRTGGTINRTLGQIFINTFQGKMAEYALYRYFERKNILIDKPDTEQHKLGVWDSFDLSCQEKHISIKSTKEYGDLLLLETGDWNDDGEYIPNQNIGNVRYDYTCLVRFSPDGEKIMRENGLLWQRDKDVPGNIREILIEKVRDIDWKYDFPGFIFYSELVKMIRDRHVIPKGAMLNGKTKMDAENYYFQTGNMHDLIDSYTINKNTEGTHDKDMLKRTCPKCGKTLVIRHGYNDFWGCEGYKNGCRYTESLENT